LARSCRIILNPLPWITAASGSYCWVHVALNGLVLGFVWMLADWLVESDVEGNREEHCSPRPWFILRQHCDFRVDGLKPQDTRELSPFEPRIILEPYWCINLLSDVTILESSCKFLRLFFFFSGDSEVWLCMLYLALTVQPSIENIPLHVCPWRWTSCSLCRGSLHISRDERLFFCNRLMHAFRLNKKIYIVTLYQELPLHHKDEPFISGHPWLFSLTLTGDTRSTVLGYIFQEAGV